MVLSIRCNLCRRTVHYWAADLVQILGPRHPVERPPWPCGTCRTSDYLDLRCQVLTSTEMRGLTVRRPVRQIVRWQWRDEPM